MAVCFFAITWKLVVSGCVTVSTHYELKLVFVVASFISDGEMKRKRQRRREDESYGNSDESARHSYPLRRNHKTLHRSRERAHFSCPLSLMNLFYVCNLWVSARKEKCLTMPREDELFRNALTLLRINRATVLSPVSYFRPSARSTRGKETDRNRQKEKESVRSIQRRRYYSFREGAGRDFFFLPELQDSWQGEPRRAFAKFPTLLRRLPRENAESFAKVVSTA